MRIKNARHYRVVFDIASYPFLFHSLYRLDTMKLLAVAVALFATVGFVAATPVPRLP